MSQVGSERIKLFASRISRERDPLEVADSVARLLYPERTPLVRARLLIERPEKEATRGALIFFSSPTDSGNIIEDISSKGVPGIFVEQGRFRGYFIYLDPGVLSRRSLTERGLAKELLARHHT